VGASRSHSYDSLSRLTLANGPWEKPLGYPSAVNWTYSYDPLGNLLVQTSSRAGAGDRRVWSYTDATRPHLMTSFSQLNKWTETVTSTPFGEPAQIARSPGSTDTLTWNAQGKLYQVKDSSYSYDAFDQNTLVVTGTGSGQTSIVRVGDDFEYDLVAGRATKYFSVDGVRIAVLATSYTTGPASAPSNGPGTFGRPAEKFLGYLTDHLGSVRAVVNQNGVVVETRDYDPFGGDVTHVGAFSTQHRFTGQPADDQGRGLYNYGARFYNPRWGRFISADEVTQGFDSQATNPFAYTSNQPTGRIDPSGNDDWAIAPAIPLLGGDLPTYSYGPKGSSNYDKEVRTENLSNVIAEMRLNGMTSDDGNLDELADIPIIGVILVDTPFAVPATPPWVLEGVVGGVETGGWGAVLCIVVCPGTLGIGDLGPATVPTVDQARNREGSGKNEPHGDAGKKSQKGAKLIEKIRSEIAKLRGQPGTSREIKQLEQKIQNIIRAGQRAAKGETHWR